MTNYYILNHEGQPVGTNNVEEWARWYEKAERHIGDTVVGDSRISTVFLSLDHQFGNGAPILWETMVFGGPLDGECERYETREEALIGHQATVDRVRAQIDASGS